MKLKKIVEYLNHLRHSHNKILVALDIDETILFFEELDTKWWSITFNDNYKTLKCSDKSDKQTLKDWQKLIGIHKPKMVDFVNFNTILNTCLENEHIDIVFITARDKSITDVTLQHFEQLGIPTHLPIVFCGSSNKGKALSKYIENIDIHHIIFADDIKHNIDDVENEFKNKENIVLKTFLIE